MDRTSPYPHHHRAGLRPIPRPGHSKTRGVTGELQPRPRGCSALTVEESPCAPDGRNIGHAAVVIKIVPHARGFCIVVMRSAHEDADSSHARGFCAFARLQVFCGTIAPPARGFYSFERFEPPSGAAKLVSGREKRLIYGVDLRGVDAHSLRESQRGTALQRRTNRLRVLE